MHEVRVQPRLAPGETGMPRVLGRGARRLPGHRPRLDDFHGHDNGPLRHNGRGGPGRGVQYRDGVFQGLGRPGDEPPAMLREMIDRGDLGLKTGRGFYDWKDPEFARPGFISGKK
ncbi:MAG: hypothetical protein EHM32_03505 [Spirochaetales bacterium]|nr:MAG: hypothetical protein EHM32_03505 [Spirochaetales bacterium]